MVRTYRDRMQAKEAKIVLNTIKNIRKMANIKLAVDNMALKLGGFIK